MNTPKMYFDTEEELFECFKKWQKRLCLSDWNIGLALVEPDDIEKGNAGESDVQWVHRCGTISILKKEYIPNDLLLKQPHEESLIHEMLHFRFLAFEEKSREEATFEIMQHQLLDDMARALFLAEYDLQSDWFIKESKNETDN